MPKGLDGWVSLSAASHVGMVSQQQRVVVFPHTELRIMAIFTSCARLVRTIMYSDEDGIASKRSQAVYDTRMRTLLFTTSLLSWVGFGAAILEGAYTKEGLRFPRRLDESHLSYLNKIIWPIIVLHSHCHSWKNSPISLYAAGLRGSVLSLIVVSSQLLTKAGHDPKPLFAMSWASLQLYSAVLLVIVQVLFPRRPDLFTPEGRPVDLERSSSAFSRYTMLWCTTALMLAGKPASIDELPVLDYLTRSRSQPLIVISSPGATLWAHILAERYLGFLKQWILMLMRSIVTFGSPYCVMRLLKTLEDSHGRTDNAWIWLRVLECFPLSRL